MLLGAFLYAIGYWRGYRHGYRLGRAQASVEDADREIAWHKRLAHPSRWSVNRDGEVLDLANVREKASR